MQKLAVSLIFILAIAVTPFAAQAECVTEEYNLVTSAEIGLEVIVRFSDEEATRFVDLFNGYTNAPEDVPADVIVVYTSSVPPLVHVVAYKENCGIKSGMMPVHLLKKILITLRPAHY